MKDAIELPFSAGIVGYTATTGESSISKMLMKIQDSIEQRILRQDIEHSVFSAFLFSIKIDA